jgi:cyclic pyranopterin monophosphate synthase
MKLSHFDEKGKARMVDVTEKTVSVRKAVARGSVYAKASTIKLIKLGRVEKGDVLGVARVAGILGAKKTSELIPMCHPLNIASVLIDFAINTKQNRIDITTTVKVTGQTGVEMEALTGTSVAALTIYDMCKAADKEMVIGEIMLLEKSGGKSGHFKRTVSGLGV